MMAAVMHAGYSEGDVYTCVFHTAVRIAIICHHYQSLMVVKTRNRYVCRVCYCSHDYAHSTYHTPLTPVCVHIFSSSVVSVRPNKFNSYCLISLSITLSFLSVQTFAVAFSVHTFLLFMVSIILLFTQQYESECLLF